MWNGKTGSAAAEIQINTAAVCLPIANCIDLFTTPLHPFELFPATHTTLWKSGGNTKKWMPFYWLDYDIIDVMLEHNQGSEKTQKCNPPFFDTDHEEASK